MKQKGALSLLLLAAVLLLSVMPLLAGGCGKSGSSTTTTTKTSTSTSKPTTTGGSSSTTTSLTTSSTTSMPTPGGFPDIADMKSLSSYRLSIMNKGVEGIAAGMVTYLKYEWVKANQAEHAWMEDANGNVTEVYIKIGNKYWMWIGIGGMGWVEQQPQTTTTSPGASSDIAAQLKKAMQDVANSKASFKKIGTETVNGVSCSHYQFEYSLTTELPSLGGGTQKATEHSTGDMWIASQSGLPAVIISSRVNSDITMDSGKTVMDTETNLTDIGAAITINPPDDAFTPPTTTGLPTTTTTHITTTSTTTTYVTTTTTGEPPAFSDDFNGGWDSAWAWTDPNSDVTRQTGTHPGFLRLIVPDGNDLDENTNYDAPRLLVARDGDFTIETRIEFDPQEHYQGAGLLIWQDEDTFLRFEFGYGGMGGAAKNVVFVAQEISALSYIGSVDLPDTQTSIELRLERVGYVFTASYKDADGNWQPVGYKYFTLSSTVSVGIVQINQFTSTSGTADFDWVRIFQP
jgi:regulation of enolase protein 1 (concanavalin A-like superfamily)